VGVESVRASPFNEVNCACQIDAIVLKMTSMRRSDQRTVESGTKMEQEQQIPNEIG
jgi:hypothetical protein